MQTLKQTLKSIEYETQSIQETQFTSDLSTVNKTKFLKASKIAPLLGIEFEYDLGTYSDYVSLENYALEASKRADNLPLILKPDLSLNMQYNTELNTAPAPLYQTLKFVKNLYQDSSFFHKDRYFIHSRTGAHIHFAIGTEGSKSWFNSVIAIGIFVMLANSRDINRSDTVESLLHRNFQAYTERCSTPFSFAKLESSNIDLSDLPSYIFYGGLARLRTDTVEWRSPKVPGSYKEFVESLVVALLMINFSNRFARYYVDTYCDEMHTPKVKGILFRHFLQYFEKRHLAYINFFCNMSFED